MGNTMLFSDNEAGAESNHRFLFIFFLLFLPILLVDPEPYEKKISHINLCSAGRALHSLILPSRRNYGTIFCPEPIGANCLFINGVAVAPVSAPRTIELLRTLPDVKVETVDMGELAKVQLFLLLLLLLLLH